MIRTEPRAGISDFEPNYLAAIDLYDEDFLWRYSPFPVDKADAPAPAVDRADRAQRRRVRADGRAGPAVAGDPVDGEARNEDIFPVSRPGVRVGARASERRRGPRHDARSAAAQARCSIAIRTRPTRGSSARASWSRTPATPAFVVPAFDVGRRAGLGEVIADNDDGSTRSWAGPAVEFPVYYEWRFRTGVEGDFEQLVHALVPRDMDPRVGVRDMDISRPGFGVAHVSNPPDDRVSLEGALLAPTTVRRGLAPESDFAPQIAAVINAPAEAMAAPPSSEIGGDDPVVAPPIYGSLARGRRSREAARGRPGLGPGAQSRSALSRGRRARRARRPEASGRSTCARRGSRSATC